MNGSAEIEACSGAALSARLADFVALTKPRITVLVLVPTLVGFALAAGTAGTAWAMLHTAVGVVLLAAGANTLNQVMERDRDALMTRTHLRPLPAGRMPVVEAAAFGIGLAVIGTAYLALLVNALAAALGAATALGYLFLYTPLKRVTALNTVVGAVPGALPPVIGWAAGRGTVEPPALILFAILFLWQMPHFYSIAWIYRDDYARAGFRMLPSLDPHGNMTGIRLVVYSIALLGVSLLPASAGLTGPAYVVGALLLGMAFSAVGVRVALGPTRRQARGYLLASVVYLPLLYLLMLVDRAGATA